MTTEYIKQQVTQSIVVTNLMNGESIATLQSAYPLTEADYERLQAGAPMTSTLAAMLFSGVVGYAISLGPKLESLFSDGKLALAPGETKTIVIGSAISAVVYLAGLLLPNKRKSVMEKLKAHFNDARPSTHIVGGGK